MAKPGVMFYFDVRPCIKRLDTTEKGLLFEAILDYGEFGIIPEFDGVLGIAWDFIQPKLDKDAGRYDKQVEQRQYAVYAREMKKKGQTPLSFDAWKMQYSNESNRTPSDDNGRYPTSTNNLQLQPQLTTPTSIYNKADKPPTRHRFSPPTVDEVREYCLSKGYAVDPDRFVDYYTSNGWIVGKTKMKDWRAAVRNWNGKEKKNGKTESKSLWSIGTEV